MHSITSAESVTPPAAPVLWVRGRRIEVGEARRDGRRWTWVRRVRREPRGRFQAHWWRLKSAWVLSVDLLQQVAAAGFAWIEYCDEHRDRWTIPTADALKGARFEIQGQPHVCLPAGVWHQQRPADPVAVQQDLFTGR